MFGRNSSRSLPIDDSVLDDDDEMEMEELVTDSTPAHYYHNDKYMSTKSTPFNIQQLLRSIRGGRKQQILLVGLLLFILVGMFCLGKLDLWVTKASNTHVNLEEPLGNNNNNIHEPNVPVTPDVAEGVANQANANSTATAAEDSSSTNVNGEGGAITKPTKKEEEKEKPPKDWGHWKFYDGNEKMRPNVDYSMFPNKDITAESLPVHAWQADAVYVNHFVDEAKKLLRRAQEAIYEEYGHGEPRTQAESMEARKMFLVSNINITSISSPQKQKDFSGQGGWTTKRSSVSLARRLLHAMMTRGTFTVVMAGSDPGHGNHFSQSYMMQFHHVMEPIFERLGMKLLTRNMGQGGVLGTIHNALGAQSIYGDEVDIIVWDSHHTTGKADFDFFCRQALLGSKRAPFILGLGGVEFEVLQMLHDVVGADVGGLGSGMSGVAVTVDEVQAETLPWAVRYVNCPPDNELLCEANKFSSKCWVDREDVTPPTTQLDVVPGQESGHPGFRRHQLMGRVMASYVLRALEEALQKWSEITVLEGMPLADEHWHMSDYYDAIQQKIKKMPPSFCEEGSNGRFPARLCKVSLKARTEYTPRADPDQTSIRSILKAAPDGYVPEVAAPFYDGDDVQNPATTLPEGAFDVRSTVSKRDRRDSIRDLLYEKNLSNIDSRLMTTTTEDPSPHSTEVGSIADSQNLRRADENVVVTPGRGWMVHSEPAGFCDGSPLSRCGRQASSNCLLSGHNDGRGGIQGDGLSGWLVMNLEGVKEGIIVMNIDFHHGKDPRTMSWTEENGGNSTRRDLVEDGNDNEELPDSTVFEYSINGKISQLSKTQLMDEAKLVERLARWIVLLDDDEDMATSRKVRNIELAIRLVGCDRECNLSVNHVYWA